MYRIRIPDYEEWEATRIWQLARLHEDNFGAPKVLDARRALAEYPPVHIIHIKSGMPNRNLVDWDTVSPALVCSTDHQTFCLSF